MPVNSTSTGASYGKSSDPLCPLGFHPQVRWPTRCKRCFRDYKEHLDASDKARFANTDSNTANGRRPGFSKSKSLDVTTSEMGLEMAGGAESAANKNYGRFFEAPKAKSVLPNEFQGIPKVIEMTAAAAAGNHSRSQSSQPDKDDSVRGRSRTPNYLSLQEEINKLQDEIKSLQEQNDELKREQYKHPVSFETVKATETTNELAKAKQKINDQDMTIGALEKEKNCLTVKLRDMEETLDKRTQAPRISKTLSEMEAKLRFLDKKCKGLESENDRLQNSVQVLEGELEEVQDNFREDEADEYRNLKRELENAGKNCRVLQFKLKKAEKTLADTLSEKAEMEKQMKDINKGGVNMLDSVNKIKALEKELSQKKDLNAKYELQISELKYNKSPNMRGPCLSRTGSIDKAVEDQLLKDLQDSIERENDLKEQMAMAEEDTSELRIKVSRLEDENESLLQQVKKMSTKGGRGRRTPSPSQDKRDQNDENSDMNVEDIKLQLEISEQEVTVLRKKVDTVLGDNLKLSKQVKDLDGQLSISKKKQPQNTGWRTASHSSSAHEKQLETLQDELNDTRIKLIEKERECEQQDTQLKTMKNKTVSRKDGSQQKQLEVIEKEASILRRRNSELEGINEMLKNESKQHSKKLPASSMEKLKMDKFALEEKVAKLEKEMKDKDRIIVTLREKSPGMSSLEQSKIRREMGNLNDQVASLQESKKGAIEEIDKLKLDLAESLERQENVNRNMDKVKNEKGQLSREVQKLNNELGTADSKISIMKQQVEDQKAAIEDLKSKSTNHLQQTQEGVKTFKEHIDTLKKELKDEKEKVKKFRQNKDAEQLNERIKDLEDKWAKSKRINQQRKEKIENLEKEIEKVKQSNTGLDKLRQAESTISNQRKRIQDLERQLWKEDSSEDSNEQLQKEYDALKRDHATIQSELTTLRHTYNHKADDWIREKLEIQKRMRELEDSFAKTAGEGWSNERSRFKQIIEDRDSQIIQLKIESDVARSQMSTLKKETDELKVKLQDYEKMSKFQRVVSNDDDENMSLKHQLSELQKQLSGEKKDKKSELNLVKLKHDSKIAVMVEEMNGLKAQCSKYRRERETYKTMVEGVQKTRYTQKGNEKDQLSELQIQLQVLEDELADAKLETSKTNANAISVKANYEIEIAELKSKINELNEEALIESGRARIAGTRTKMELAWQKERDGQKRLINELNTMARDLKATLLEYEKERERERLESKRKNDAAKVTFDEEHKDMKKQISDLQYDLLELRDAHTKLRSTNEKLRRDKEKADKDKEDLRGLVSIFNFFNINFDFYLQV